MSRQQVEAALLEAGLEEKFGRECAPDVVARVLDAESEDGAEPRPRGAWGYVLRAAAVILACGIVWRIAVGGVGVDPVPIQDPHNAPTRGDEIAPKTRAEFVELLADVVQASVWIGGGLVEAESLELVPASVPGEPDVDPVALRWDDSVRAAFEKSSAGTPAQTALVVVDGESSVDLRDRVVLTLVDGRELRMRFDPRGPQWIELAFGRFGAGAVAEQWRAELAAARRRVLAERGVVHASWLTDKDALRGADTRRMRLHGFDLASLRSLPLGSIEKLDVRWSPALHSVEAIWNWPTEMPALTSLTLDAMQFEPSVMTQLGAAPLEELLILPRDGAPWDRTTSVTGSRLDARSMLRFAELHGVRHLAIPGAQLDDDALRTLGRMPDLERLVLTGAHGFTGEGFDTSYEISARLRIESFQQLREVNLSQCRGLTDRGIAMLAEKPRLEEIYLDGTRVVDGMPGAERLTAASLQSLAQCKTLRRVDIAAWFTPQTCDIELGHSTGIGPYYHIEQEWLDALRELVAAGHVEMLALADCPVLRLEHLEPLKYAKGLEVLFLNGSVDVGPSNLSVEQAAEFLFEHLEGVTIVSN